MTLMVSLNALNKRVAALCGRSAAPTPGHNFLFFSTLSSFFQGLRQDQNTDYIASSYSKSLPFISSSCYVVKFSNLYSTACQCPEEERALAGDADKIRNAADVFRDWGCSESDISRIFERCSSLRKSNSAILQSKLELLHQLGIKSADLVKMIHIRPRFLNCRLNTFFDERLRYLESLFGSRDALTKAIVRNPTLLLYDIHNQVKPVIAIYESLGISKSDLIAMTLSRPTLIPRTKLDDEKINFIRRTGVSKDSKIYKHVVTIFAISRIQTIRGKIMHLEKYGLSEDDIFGLIGRSPLVLTLSIDKIQRNMTFVIGTMKLSATVVLQSPFLLFSNLETVLKPRFKIACKIEEMGLVPQVKGSALLRALRMSEKRFISVYITCHPENDALDLVTAYRNAKCIRRLAESSKKNLHIGFPF